MIIYSVYKEKELEILMYLRISHLGIKTQMWQFLKLSLPSPPSQGGVKSKLRQCPPLTHRLQANGSFCSTKANRKCPVKEGTSKL